MHRALVLHRNKPLPLRGLYVLQGNKYINFFSWIWFGPLVSSGWERERERAGGVSSHETQINSVNNDIGATGRCVERERLYRPEPTRLRANRGKYGGWVAYKSRRRRRLPSPTRAIPAATRSAALFPCDEVSVYTMAGRHEPSTVLWLLHRFANSIGSAHHFRSSCRHLRWIIDRGI